MKFPPYHELLDEVIKLRIENERLLKKEKEYAEFVQSTIRHSDATSMQMLNIFLTPGVTEAVRAQHEKDAG